MVRTDPPRPALRRFWDTHFGHRFTQLRFSSGMNSRVQTEQERQPLVSAHLEQNAYAPYRRRTLHILHIGCPVPPFPMPGPYRGSPTMFRPAQPPLPRPTPRADAVGLRT